MPEDISSDAPEDDRKEGTGETDGKSLSRNTIGARGGSEPQAAW
jgi:hypothetical protein